MCHKVEYNSWLETTHAKATEHAMDSTDREYTAECLTCHATNADENLAGVQCEACHGYGSPHARDGKWVQQAKDSCVMCHDEKNSPDFDYATYWEKIKH